MASPGRPSGLALGGLAFALANYDDDHARQSSQFVVGMAIFRYGFIALVLVAVAAMVAAALKKR